MRVEKSEIFVKFLCRFISNRGSGLFIAKQSQMNMPIFDGYLGLPFLACLIPSHTYVPTAIVTSEPSIAFILRTVRFAQILSAIIERIMVAMFRFLLGIASKYFSGHMDDVTLLSPDHSETFDDRVPISRPIPLVKPFKVCGIHDGILTLRKWDQSVGWVKRLDDFVSANTAFRHRSTSSRSLLPAAL